jgi:hypothetical protein
MNMRVEWIGSAMDVRPAMPDARVGVGDIFGWLGGSGTLGQPPTSCPGGNTPAAFNTCRAQALNQAKSSCAQKIPASAFQTPGGGVDEAALAQAIAQCQQSEFFFFFNQLDCLGKCPGAVPPCASKQIIESVQADLGRPVTGVWTQADEDALTAKGTDFITYAPSCTGAAPIPIDATGGGGGGPKPVEPPATSSKSSSGWGVALLAAAGIAVLALSSS